VVIVLEEHSNEVQDDYSTLSVSDFGNQSESDSDSAESPRDYSDFEVGKPSNPDTLPKQEEGLNPHAPFIERMSGDGVLDETGDYMDDVNIRHGDGRSDARTYFNPDDAEHSSVNYENLYKLNQGERIDRDRSIKNRKADRERDIGVLSSQLGLTRRQEERIKYIIDDYNFNGMKFENVLLAVVSLVAAQDGRLVHEETRWDDIVTGMGATNDRVDYYRDKFMQETEYFQ
jgi:hypothetical protein